MVTTTFFDNSTTTALLNNATTTSTTTTRTTTTSTTTTRTTTTSTKNFTTTTTTTPEITSTTITETSSSTKGGQTERAEIASAVVFGSALVFSLFWFAFKNYIAQKHMHLHALEQTNVNPENLRLEVAGNTLEEMHV